MNITSPKVSRRMSQGNNKDVYNRGDPRARRSRGGLHGNQGGFHSNHGDRPVSQGGSRSGNKKHGAGNEPEVNIRYLFEQFLSSY